MTHLHNMWGGGRIHRGNLVILLNWLFKGHLFLVGIRYFGGSLV